MSEKKAEKRRAEASVVRAGEGSLRVELKGAWRVSSRRPTVEEVVEGVTAAPAARRVIFAAEGVEEWDSVLPAFLVKVRSALERSGMEVELAHLPGGVKRLLALAAAVPRHEAPPPPPRERFPLLAHLGERSLSAGRAFANALDFTGQVTCALGRFFRGRAWFRTSDLLFQIQECGHRALPIAMLISFLVGLILAFVGAVQLAQFGAEIFVASLVGIAMVRAMGAVMTGIIMAGRNGAAFAAELGTMQVNEETDALRTLGIPPVEFLVLPRLLAMALMMPLLCIFADLVGTAGGFIVGVGLYGLNPIEYFNQTREAIPLSYFWIGLFHSFVFGILVAGTGCYKGLKCGRSAADVGRAATSAVVTGIVLIIVATAIITVCCNVLGI